MEQKKLPPVFTGTCYTGQPMTDHEEIVCPVCNDTDNLVRLRWSGWYDSYRDGGKYVHRGCLSKERQAELIALDVAEQRQREVTRQSAQGLLQSHRQSETATSLEDQEIIAKTDTEVLKLADELYSELPLHLAEAHPIYKSYAAFEAAVQRELQKRLGSSYCPVVVKRREPDSSSFNLDTQLEFATVAGLKLLEEVYAFYKVNPDRPIVDSTEGYDHLQKHLRVRQYVSLVYCDRSPKGQIGRLRILFHRGDHRFAGSVLLTAATIAQKLCQLNHPTRP